MDKRFAQMETSLSRFNGAFEGYHDNMSASLPKIFPKVVRQAMEKQQSVLERHASEHMAIVRSGIKDVRSLAGTVASQRGPSVKKSDRGFQTDRALVDRMLEGPGAAATELRQAVYTVDDATEMLQRFAKYRETNPLARPDQFFEIRRFPSVFDRKPLNDCHRHFLQVMTRRKLEMSVASGGSTTSATPDILFTVDSFTVFNHGVDGRFFHGIFLEGDNRYLCVLLFFEDDMRKCATVQMQGGTRRNAVERALKNALGIRAPSAIPVRKLNQSYKSHMVGGKKQFDGITIFEGIRSALSNEAATSFTYNYARFLSVEHAYLAMMAVYFSQGESVAKMLKLPDLNCLGADAQAIMKKQVSSYDRWYPNPAFTLVYEICRAKFKENLLARTTLLLTGQSRIHRGTKHRFFGCGYTKGQEELLLTNGIQKEYEDNLGIILTHIRGELEVETKEKFDLTLPKPVLGATPLFAVGGTGNRGDGGYEPGVPVNENTRHQPAESTHSAGFHQTEEPPAKRSRTGFPSAPGPQQHSSMYPGDPSASSNGILRSPPDHLSRLPAAATLPTPVSPPFRQFPTVQSPSKPPLLSHEPTSNVWLKSAPPYDDAAMAAPRIGTVPVAPGAPTLSSPPGLNERKPSRHPERIFEHEHKLLMAQAPTPALQQLTGSGIYYSLDEAWRLAQKYADAKRHGGYLEPGDFLDVRRIPPGFEKTPLNDCHLHFLQAMTVYKMSLDARQLDARLLSVDMLNTTFNSSKEPRFVYAIYQTENYHWLCVIMFFDNDMKNCHYFRHNGDTLKLAVTRTLQDALGLAVTPFTYRKPPRAGPTDYNDYMKTTNRAADVGAYIFDATEDILSFQAVSPFSYNNIRFQSVEHAYLFFMAIFFERYTSTPNLLRAPTNLEMLREAQPTIKLRDEHSDDWYPNPAFNLTTELNRAKFNQCEAAYKALMATGNASIHEGSSHWFFGCGYAPGDERRLVRDGIPAKFEDNMGTVLTYIRVTHVQRQKSGGGGLQRKIEAPAGDATSLLSGIGMTSTGGGSRRGNDHRAVDTDADRGDDRMSGANYRVSAEIGSPHYPLKHQNQHLSTTSSGARPGGMFTGSTKPSTRGSSGYQQHRDSTNRPGLAGSSMRRGVAAPKIDVSRFQSVRPRGGGASGSGAGSGRTGSGQKGATSGGATGSGGGSHKFWDPKRKYASTASSSAASRLGAGSRQPGGGASGGSSRGGGSSSYRGSRRGGSDYRKRH